MGDYDSRVNELREQLKAASQGAEERAVKRLEESISQWGSERESLLRDLIDLADRASATNQGTADKWKSRVDSARQKVGSLFGEAAKDQMLPPGLQLFWATAVRLEDEFLSSLAAVETPKLLDQLHTHQVGLGKLIEELADKWRYLLQADLALEAEELRVLDDLDRLVQDALFQVTPVEQKLKESIEQVEGLIKAITQEIGKENAATLVAKVIEKIFETKAGDSLKGLVKIATTWLSVKSAELKAALARHQKNVQAYRELLSREKGTVLAAFKENRDKVTRYQQENGLAKARDWNEQAVRVLDAWADARGTAPQQVDAHIFAVKIYAQLDEVFDLSESFDQKFRAEFEGLFWGPLRSDRMEELIEIQKFAERVRQLETKALPAALETAEEELREAQESFAEKALAPLNDLPSGLSAEAREIVQLRTDEFRQLIRDHLEREISTLLPVMAELRQMYTSSRLQQDLSREELKRDLGG